MDEGSLVKSSKESRLVLLVTVASAARNICSMIFRADLVGEIMMLVSLAASLKLSILGVVERFGVTGVGGGACEEEEDADGDGVWLR